MFTKNKGLKLKNIILYNCIVILRICSLIAIFSIFCCLQFIQVAHADYGVMLMPSIVELKSSGRSDIKYKLKIKNLSDEDATFQILLKQIGTSGADNENVVISDTDLEHKKLFQNTKIKYNNEIIDSITLKRSELKEIEIEILSQKLLKNDYYFTLVAKSNNNANPKEDNSSATLISYETGALFLLSIGNENVTSKEIGQLSVSFLHTKGPINISGYINNQSDRYITTRSRIIIKNMFGKTISSIGLKPQILLPNQSKSITADRQNTAELPKNHQSIIWSDDFLLGLYTVELITYSAQTDLDSTSKAYFIVLPLYTLIPATVFMLILLRFYLRVKKKLSEQDIKNA